MIKSSLEELIWRKSENVNSSEFKNVIKNVIIAKEISQRNLTKLSWISRSTLNDIFSGKIKKVDVASLKKIPET